MYPKHRQYTRRHILKLGAASGAATLIGRSAWSAVCTDNSIIDPMSDLEFTGCSVGGEPMSTSPLILQPFQDPLPIP
jgi:hypothetical protein